MTLRRITHLWFIAFISLLLSCILGVSVLAANFRVSPAEPNSQSPKSESWFVYDTEPGAVIEDRVKIENETLDDILVQVSAHDLKITNNGNFTVKSENEENTDVGTWIELNEATYIIPARGLIEIPFTLTIPENVEDGEYAAGITAFEVDDSLTAFEVLVRQGARIYIEIGEQHSVESSIENFEIIDITDENYVNSLPINQSIGKDILALEYMVEYSGNIFGELKGIVELEFEDGSSIEKAIREELIPGSPELQKFIITEEPYQAGLTQARFLYEVNPLNTSSDVNVSGVLEDDITLDAEALGLTNNAENPTISAPRSVAPISQETVNRAAYIIGGVIIFLLVAATGVVVYAQRKIRKN